MEEDLKYTRILRALMELPFQVGKNLLIDFLTGDYSNKSISKNRLDELDNFDSLSWDKSRVSGEIDRLISNGMIEMVQSDYNRFVKVLSLTIRGRNEITHPSLEAKRLGNRVGFNESKVSSEDKLRFLEFEDFLKMYNEEQKKAIISDAKNILCVAGAGSGKTTVLTKRIEFLVKHKGVTPEKILAITFTRKARLEMKRRLDELGVSGVKVHTFNSFCERILQKYGSEIYGRNVRVIGYGDKVLAMNMAVATLGLDMDSVIDEYFNAGQKKFRTSAQLSNAFMSDCFAVMDYFKVSGKKDYDWSLDVSGKDRVNAERIYRITKYLREHMETQGLRDYSDQIIDTIKFFGDNPSGIPIFEHILVDEYQDVNAMQIELIGLLKPENLFVVGDPRQSIFGWRGSDLNYILNFEKDFGDAEVVHLKKNYRSFPGVVEFMNHAIRDMKLPDLVAHLKGEARIRIMDFSDEDSEREFVLREIEDSAVSLDEVFVLARTNKILLELSRAMSAKRISHVVRADESGGRVPANGERSEDSRFGVTLATVHAIKGLEAKKVFVIGASETNFPCKTSDHPAVEMVKMDDYDREEEERRLFYVAISRAREELVVTYTKKPTYYITPAMRGLVGSKTKELGIGDLGLGNVNEGLLGELKSWRSVLSEERGVPAYTILTNATIEEIAVKVPKSAEELIKISGIGPEKLMRYGKKILEIVGEFEKEVKR
jgi:superfamily I DNA/RNA helicase